MNSRICDLSFQLGDCRLEPGMSYFLNRALTSSRMRVACVRFLSTCERGGAERPLLFSVTQSLLC